MKNSSAESDVGHSAGTFSLSDQDIEQAAQRLTGKPAIDIERIGSSRSKSVRVRLQGEESFLILTRRDSENRALLESKVLEALFEQNAPSPQLVARDGCWLAQEDLGKSRMHDMLGRANEMQAARIMDGAISALAACQLAGENAGLNFKVVRIGESTDWLVDVIAAPNRLGQWLGCLAPDLDVSDLSELLRIRDHSFVKWDARPPNAITYKNGRAGWFDWEHCGVRNKLDDLVWFFGDGTCPELPTFEMELLNHYLPKFRGELNQSDALQYFYCFGAIHCAHRLSIHLKHSLVGEDLNPEDVEAGRKLQNLSASGLRVCMRGRRWSEAGELVRPLTEWYDRLLDRFQPSEEGRC